MSRELLQQALKAQRELIYDQLCYDVYAEPSSLERNIEAELARTEWVKFADALPVVPEGKTYVQLWEANATTGEVIDCDYGKGFGVWDEATHWMYRQDDTPQPPRSES